MYWGTINMRKLFLFLTIAFILFSSSTSYARTKVFDYVRKGGKSVKVSTTSTYKLMETYPNSTVTVYKAGTLTLATIYSNSSGTIKANPFTAGADASYSFYIDAKKYDIKFSGTGITTPFTRTDLTVNDSLDDFDVRIYGATCNGSVADTAAFIAANTDAALVDSQILVPANVTCLLNSLSIKNISLGFNSKLSINTGQEVNITGLFSAHPTHVFTGSGTVKFTGPYPDVFYAEWWGAKGDNVTNDLPAFNKMLDAMQGVNSENFQPIMNVGGVVQLITGRQYFLADTLHVRRPVHIKGGSGEYFGASTWLRFPKNTRGIISHGFSTFDGSGQIPKAAFMATFENFGIKGGLDLDTNNTIVSTSGLNITMTGGAITDASIKGSTLQPITSPALAPGSTVKVNGYNYVVDSTLSATSPNNVIPIVPPRLFILADGTNVIKEATGTQNFPTMSDWVGQTLRIGNNTYTINSMTSGAGILSTLTLNTTVPAGLYNAKVTTGIKVQAGIAARLNIYNGLDFRIQGKFKNLTITGFAGNGIQCNSSQNPTAYPNGEPNCNNSWLERIHANFNSGAGVLLLGINANNIETHSLNLENNKGWALYEESLGNNHYGFHTAYNGSGAFRASPNGSTMITDSYTEGAQPSAICGQGTEVKGGNHGAFFDFDDGYACFVGNTGAGQHESYSGFVFRRRTGRYLTIDNPKAIAFSIGTKNIPNTFLTFGAAEEPVNLASGGTLDNAVVYPYAMHYNLLDTGWYHLAYGANYSDQTKNLLAFSGGLAAQGGGKLWLPNGIHYFGSDKSIGFERLLASRLKITDGAAGYSDIDVDDVNAQGAITADSIALGTGNVVTKFITATAVLNFPSTISPATSDLVVAVTGAQLGDTVSLGVPNGAMGSTSMYFAWVNAAGQVTVRFFPTTGTVDPASGTFRISITQY